MQEHLHSNKLEQFTELRVLIPITTRDNQSRVDG